MQATKRWILTEADDQEARQIGEALHLSPIVARLLCRRGIRTVDEAQQFLAPHKDGFYDPWLMKDMDKSVERIRRAIAEGERVMVYGDYDADGATATSLLYLALRAMGAQVDSYIPDRFSEGYGLNVPAIEGAKEQGYTLVITVDNGISAHEPCRVAKELGLDMIVTDHHTPPDVLPDAYAILNPKQPGCQYPDAMIAGVGVAFKLVQALLGRLPEEYLDLAALGTVADLAPLVNENRLFTVYGLEKMNQAPRPGIRALLDVAGLTGKRVTAGHIGFSLGPRINASGRLDSATYAVQLLTTDDPVEAGELARFLEERNTERQAIGEQIFEEAVALVENNPQWLDGRVLVVAHEGWNEGVIGIVASRLVERYYRPTLMIALHPEGTGKASARSIHGFDLYQALTQCADLLGHYGGHKMAAGFSISADQVEHLRTRINQVAADVLTEEDMRPKLDIDAQLELAEVDLQLVEEIEQLAPYGFGNPSPRFSFSGLKVRETRVVGKDATHLQLKVEHDKRHLSCIAFRRSEDQQHIDQLSSIDLVGELQINEWNGRRDLQLLLGDWRAGAFQFFDYRFAGDKSVWVETHKEPLSILCFQPQQLEALEQRLMGYPWNEGKYRLFQIDETGAWVPRNSADEPTDHLVWFDLPETIEQLEASLGSILPQHRLYFVQGQSDQQWLRQRAIDALPHRDRFTDVYRLLRRQGSIERHQLLTSLRGAVTSDGLDTILQVFGELGFAKLEGETYHVVESADKRELTASTQYQQQSMRVTRMKKVNDLLLNASSDTLREWLVRQLGGRA